MTSNSLEAWLEAPFTRILLNSRSLCAVNSFVICVYATNGQTCSYHQHAETLLLMRIEVFQRIQVFQNLSHICCNETVSALEYLFCQNHLDIIYSGSNFRFSESVLAPLAPPLPQYSQLALGGCLSQNHHLSLLPFLLSSFLWKSHILATVFTLALPLARNTFFVFALFSLPLLSFHRPQLREENSSLSPLTTDPYHPVHPAPHLLSARVSWWPPHPFSFRFPLPRFARVTLYCPVLDFVTFFALVPLPRVHAFTALPTQSLHLLLSR